MKDLIANIIREILEKEKAIFFRCVFLRQV
jgi:hypothetical protein